MGGEGGYTAEHILTAVLDGDELSTSLTGRPPHFDDH